MQQGQTIGDGELFGQIIGPSCEYICDCASVHLPGSLPTFLISFHFFLSFNKMDKLAPRF